MADLRFRQQVRTFINDRENPLLRLANDLILHLEERFKAGKTRRKRIGLAGGNPCQISVDAVTIRWNRWKKTADPEVADRRHRLTIIDTRGRIPARELLLPDSDETHQAAIDHVVRIWESREEKDEWFYQI